MNIYPGSHKIKRFSANICFFPPLMIYYARLLSIENKNSIPILEKSLDVIEYIAASDTPVRLPELQENPGIAQASCCRIVSTLLQRGWLEKCPGNRCEIAAGLVRVTDKIRFRLEKYKHRQPAMNRLANLTGFSAKLSVPDESREIPSEYPFDTLSFPVKQEAKLLGVISFPGLPGVLAGECDRIAVQMKGALRGIVNSL